MPSDARRAVLFRDKINKVLLWQPSWPSASHSPLLSRASLHVASLWVDEVVAVCFTWQVDAWMSYRQLPGRLRADVTAFYANAYVPQVHCNQVTAIYSC